MNSSLRAYITSLFQFLFIISLSHDMGYTVLSTVYLHRDFYICLLVFMPGLGRNTAVDLVTQPSNFLITLYCVNTHLTCTPVQHSCAVVISYFPRRIPFTKCTRQIWTDILWQIAVCQSVCRPHFVQKLRFANVKFH